VTLLTILIPTRNRPNKLQKQIETLIEITKDLGVDEVQIVVSDNSDESLDLNHFKTAIKVVRAKSRFRTFEEHFFWAISQIDSEYIWTLGDDDPPISESFLELIALLRRNSYDILVFNGWKQRVNGKKSFVISSDHNCIESSYREFIVSAGYWGVGAGISLHIFRKKFIKPGILKAISDLQSPIYSHVTLFLHSFNQASFMFVNKPLVFYNRSDAGARDGSKDIWMDYALDKGDTYRHPWTLGFLKQVEYLNSAGVFSFQDLRVTLEIDEEGRRYFLIDSLISMTLEELGLFFKKEKYNRKKLTKTELKTLKRMLSNFESNYKKLVSLLSEIDPNLHRQSRTCIKTYGELNRSVHPREVDLAARFPSVSNGQYIEFQTPNGRVFIHLRLKSFFNPILYLAIAKLGTKHMSKLPIKTNVLSTEKELWNSRTKLRLLFLFLTDKRFQEHLGNKVRSMGRYFPKLASVIKFFLRNIFRKKVRPLPNLKLFVWRVVSIFWMRLPTQIRFFIKRTLKSKLKKGE
jgi:hypothetical protein